MSILLLALTCGLVLLSVIQAQTECPRLIQTAQSSVAPSCSANSDCTGLTCTNSNLGWNVRLSVQPCTDPVVVDVTVTPTNGVNPATFVFTELGQQQQGNIAINLLRYRNASHIFVQLTSATSETLIPSVFISLNPAVCMCNSIESIIAAAPSSATCEKNANCTGTVCTAHYGGGLITVKETVTVFPCTVPPSFEMAIFDATDRQIIRRSFSHSQLANVSGLNLDFLGISNIRLNVTLIEREYSEIIQVDALYSSNKLTVLPRQQVILDKTNCVPPTPPTQSGSPFTSETCNRLQKIAADTGLIFSCSVESDCSGLTCRGLNHRMDLTIIPCASPPAFNVMLYNSSNALIYNKNITNQTTIPITAGVGINIQVKESQDGVRMKASLDPTNTAIIPYTDIPLNRCQCTNIFCNFTTSSLTPSQSPPTITKSQPSSSPKASPHTGSSNSVIIISTTSSLPPSQSPPTITKSQPSSTPKASPHTGSSNSVIIISTTPSLPPSQSPPTITKSQPSSSPKPSPHTGSSSPVIIISISVLLLVVIAIFIAATVVIVVVVILRRFRSQRQFTFQQMSTIDTDGQDDEEGYE